MAAAPPVLYVCDQCGAPADNLCAGCGKARYCKRDCQKAHWPAHRARCLESQAAARQPAQVPTARDEVGVKMQDILRERDATLRAAVEGAYTLHKPGSSAPYEVPAADIPDGTPLTVRWADKRSGASGSKGIRFLAPGSLAAELHVYSLGCVDGFKVVTGGLAYLVGEADVFWSMLHHWHASGPQRTVLPPCKPGLNWTDDSWVGREVKRVAGGLLAAFSGGPPARGTHLQSGSESAAAVAALQRVELPALTGPPDMPSTVAALPQWWRETAALWDGALQRLCERKAALDAAGAPDAGATAAGPAAGTSANEGKVAAPCMWCLTERGCVVGEAACAGAHEPAWAAAVAALKGAPPPKRMGGGSNAAAGPGGPPPGCPQQ